MRARVEKVDVLGWNKSCTVILHWGKYQYKRLPMGLSNSWTFSRRKLTKCSVDLNFSERTIYDLLIITKVDWSDKLEKLELTLKNLEITDLNVTSKSRSSEKQK